LRDLSQNRINAAVATGLTRTAVQVREAERDAMMQVFDRPTPYTLNSLWLQPASGSQSSTGTALIPGSVKGSTRLARSKFLEAQVYLKDDSAGSGTPATVYLRPQIEGGARGMKGLEKALSAVGYLPSGWRVIPGKGARLDAYGNVSRGQIIQVLSQLRVSMVAGFKRDMSFDPKKARRAQRRAGGRFFVMPAGSRAQPGVYQRKFDERDIVPIFVFVRKATYRQRFDFFGIGERVALANLKQNVGAALIEQIKRAEARSK
jgi:hypothetical protein